MWTFYGKASFCIVLGESPETMCNLCLHENFHARKLGEITVFYAVQVNRFLNKHSSLVNILAKKPYFFPTCKILEPLFLPCFFCFIISVIIFIYVFVEYWVVGDLFFVKEIEKEELNFKYFWCRIGWEVFNFRVTL